MSKHWSVDKSINAENFDRGNLVAGIVSSVVLFHCLSAEASQVQGKVERIRDATHVEFRGQSDWNYKVERKTLKNETHFVVRVPVLDQGTITRLKSWQGPLIESIDINDEAIDNSFEVTFVSKRRDVDVFDYLTDQPSRLILDFYRQTAESKKIVEENKTQSSIQQDGLKVEEKHLAEPKKKKRGTARRKVPRKPAGTDYIEVPGVQGLKTTGFSKSQPFTHGIFDGGDPDFSRFSIRLHEIKADAIRRSSRQLFIRFPMLKLESPHLKSLLDKPPIYEIISAETEENKQARLLLKLFQRNRKAVFLKTLAHFRKTFPNSEYNEIISYLEADTYYQMWEKEGKPEDFELAMLGYRDLVDQYPDSPLSERTLLLMGYSYLLRGDNFGTLQVFQKFLDRRKKSENRDRVKITMADAFLDLNKFGDAFKVFSGIERNPLHLRYGIEAAYRKGDVFFKQDQFENAINEYRRAFKKYPRYWSNFPNAFYNTAESLFWQKKYKESLDAYIEYLQRFPSHPHGGYAMTRVGELMEILGGEERKKAGAFLESYFRYRSTPGANIARIRILSDRMAKMKPKELKAAVAEIEELGRITKLPKIKEFVTLMISDGYFLRKEYQKAVDRMVLFYKRNPTSGRLAILESRIVRNINDNIRRNVENNNYMEALRLWGKYSKNWLKKLNRIDTEFLVGLAYEEAGVFGEAERVYRKTLNRILALRGTPAEKERNTFENLPSTDEVNLRLASVAVKQKDYTGAYRYLSQINLDKTTLPGVYRIETIEVAAKIEEERGNIKGAKANLKAAIVSWKGQAHHLSQPLLDLARLELKTKSYKKAAESLDRIIHLQSDTQLVNENIHAKAMRMKGETFEDWGKLNSATEAFEDYLERYESSYPSESTRYKLGDIYFRQGKLKEAEQAWAPLQESKNQVWYRLASEKLSNKKWNQDYQKYINRIPAMENIGNKGKQK